MNEKDGNTFSMLSPYAAGLINTVSRFAEEEKLFYGRKTFILSLSAGKDSCALLDVMSLLAKTNDFILTAYHLNHLARGIESDKDAEFIKNLCNSYGIELFLESHDFSESDIAFEERARRYRYRRLRNLISEKKIDAGITAHTKSDQAETVFMRIMTGTHIRGLQSIRPDLGTIIRPMLCVSADQVRSYLRARDIDWREDLSNEDERYTRNFVRKNIFPFLSEKFPRSENSLYDLTLAARESENLIRSLFEQCGVKIIRDNDSAYVRLGALAENKSAVEWIASDMLSMFGVFVTGERIKEIWRRFQMKGNRKIFDHPECILMKRTRGESIEIIAALPEKETMQWKIDGEQSMTGHKKIKMPFCTIETEIIDYSDKLNYSDPFVIYLDAEKSGKTFFIRSAINGDIIRLEGVDRTIKKILSNAHLTYNEKMKIPVFESDGNVAALGLGFIEKGSNRVSDDFRVKKGSKKILAIRRT